MKKVLLMMVAMTSLLFATSCSDDDDDTALSLSEEAIELDIAGGEKTVTVTTDAAFSAIGSADWIATKIDGSNLVITVAANETVYAREGKVLVVAGNANASILISQKGLKGQAIVHPKDVILVDKQGKEVIEIDANANKWTAKTETPWLKLEAKQFKNELILSYETNEDTADRSGLIEITVGNDKTMVDVKQLGKMFFVDTYPGLVGATREDIIAFEESRRNTLDEKNSNEERLVYETRSDKLFPNMTYNFNEEGAIQKCIINAVSAKALEENMEGFKNFLAEQGYKPGDTELDFLNEKTKIKAAIKFTTFWGMKFATVEFSPNVVQPDMPTFKELPYPFMEWGAKKPKIEEYEKENNGTYNEAISSEDPTKKNDMLAYDTDKSDEGKTKMRIYFVNHDDQPKPGLAESALLLENIDLVFFLGGGDPVLTKEFKALCKKEGFKYEKQGNGFFIFSHEEKDIWMLVGYKNYQDIGKVVHMAYFKAPEKEGTAFSIPENASINKLMRLSNVR